MCISTVHVHPRAHILSLLTAARGTGHCTESRNDVTAYLFFSTARSDGLRIFKTDKITPDSLCEWQHTQAWFPCSYTEQESIWDIYHAVCRARYSTSSLSCTTRLASSKPDCAIMQLFLCPSTPSHGVWKDAIKYVICKVPSTIIRKQAKRIKRETSAKINSDVTCLFKISDFIYSREEMSLFTNGLKLKLSFGDLVNRRSLSKDSYSCLNLQ